MSGTAIAGTETNDCIWCLTSFNRQVSKTPLSQQADALSRSHDNRVFASHTAMLFDLDRRKSQTKSGMQMSTNIPCAPVRLVRKQKQLLDIRYVLPM